MSESQLRGIFPIVYTAFDENGGIVEKDVRRIVRYLIDSGTHGLSACGSASESDRMTVDERRWLAEVVMSAAAGDVPVIVGVSTTSTADAVELATHAGRIGAEAVFGMPPAHVGLADQLSEDDSLATSWNHLAEHFGAVAEAGGIPTMVQEAGPPIDPTDIVRLCQRWPLIRYVKEERSDTGHRITAILHHAKAAGADIRIFSGGSHLVDELARGAIGAIPGSIGVADLSQTYDRWVAGDLTGACSAFCHFLPLANWHETVHPLGAKEVMRRLGVIKGAHLRPPRNSSTYLDEQDHAILTKIMEHMGPPY